MGKKLETVADFIFLGSKITVNGDCSHKINRCLLPGRKVMTNLDSILKSRDITLPTKVQIVKALVFPVVMYGCESWTRKKAEHQRGDAFKWWCWRRLLRVPWTARRTNQSILKEINPEYSLEGLMLKLQYFGHLMLRANSLEKTLILRNTEGRRRRGQQSMRWLNGITDSKDMSLSKLLEIVKDSKAWWAAFHGVTKSRTWLGDQTMKGGDGWVAKMAASPLWVGQDWCFITVISQNFSTLKRKLGPKVITSLNFPLPEDENLQWTPRSWVAILRMGSKVN